MSQLPDLKIPSHVGKTADEIVAINYFDSVGYLFRCMAWLDYFSRARTFSSLLYAGAEGRQGIECLLFEELVISTGANLSVSDYRRCVNDRISFIKTIDRLSPNYTLLRRFTRIVASLEPAVPKLIDWNLKALMRDWGTLSQYLHWVGARPLTTDKPKWLEEAHSKMLATVEPIWINITSGRRGVLHPKDMHPTAKEIWERFKTGEVDEKRAKFQLEFLRPLGR